MISIAFFTMLLSLIQFIPGVYAYNTYDCKCDHWNPQDENTVDDIFTGTGLSAQFGPYYFNAIDALFTAATGGTYSYKPSSPLILVWQSQDHNSNWYGPYAQGIPTAWLEDYDVPGGSYFEYAYYRERNIVYHYDGTTKAMRFKGLTQNWFQNPSSPGSWWLCGTTYAEVEAV